MVDKGPLLTSAIIFYLSIGAAIFQVLEEPNWKLAVKQYSSQREQILKDYPCLTKDDLDKILEVVSDASGQGVTITGERTFNNWNWPNAVIFAATVITTIGYGNIAPKTAAGQVFCIFYGLFGVPLCFTWISELGKFFGGRAKHLGHYLTKRGVSLQKTRMTCTAIFLLWGVLVHLVLPPLVFMSQEGWTYIEGLYFSFVTLTTIGFGDYVAGVDPNADYPTLYRYFVEVWIYLGLAWLSLFFNWKVRMVVEAHKALKKRRKRQKLSLSESQYSYKDTTTTSCKKSPLRSLPPAANEANIFSFLSKRQEGYSDLIKQLGKNNSNRNGSQSASSAATSPTTPGGHSVSFKETNVSKSTTTATTVTDGNGGGGGIGAAVTNSNGHTILNLERSPRQKRRYSFSDRVTVAFSKSKSYFLGQESGRLLSDMQSEADGEEEEEYDERRRRYDENQLDKEAGGGDHSSSRGLGGRARGMGMGMGAGTYCGGGGGGGIGIGGGRLSWDATDYKPMVFPNAPNITFIDEENLQGSLDDDDDTTANDPKANLAVMATDDDDNKNLDLDSQTDSESQEDDDDDDDDSESDGSVFTTDGSDHGHSYEKLVEEYSKEDNTS